MTGEHRQVMRLTYWDEAGDVHWLAFPLSERTTSEAVMLNLKERVPDAWFDWRVNIEAKRGRP